MIFLKELDVISDVVPLKAGLHITFSKNICFLLGDNGVGKSTVLDCLSDHLGHKDDTYLKRMDMGKNIRVKLKKGTKSVSLDLHASDKKFSGSFGSNIGLQMQQMKASAGQSTLLSLLEIKPVEIVDKLIILDEPCRGLSVRNQWVVSQMIKQMAERGNQVVVVTHSTLIMQELEPLAQFYDVSLGKDVVYSDHILNLMKGRPVAPVGTPPKKPSKTKAK